MRAVRYHEPGDPSVLTVEAVDRPTPSSHELLVRVEAASVNPVDLSFRSGDYPTSLPSVPGMDLAGVVVDVGRAVEAFDVGDRILAMGLPAGRGGYTEYECVPIDRAGKLPQSVDFDAGAALGLAGSTAWRAIIDYGAVEPTEVVLLHGGSGGVGHLAVQLVGIVGGTVVTTAGSTDRRRRVRALGAELVLDYANDDLAAEIGAFGQPSVVVDHRPEDYLELDLELLQQGGRLVLIEGEFPATTNAFWARTKEISMYNMTPVNAPDIPDMLSKLARLVAHDQLEVVIAETFPLAEAAQAQRRMATGHFVGKLIVHPQE